MIPLDRLRAVTHLITHANCPDGVASALIVKDALPDARVSFVKYGTVEHQFLVPAPGTLFCDFSPWLPKDGERYGTGEQNREQLIKAWLDAGVIVLDHHTRDVVEPYGELGIFGENERLECGAWLAYEHVWRPTYIDEDGEEADSVASAVADFAQRAAVRDTWKREDHRFEQARGQGELMLFWGLSRPIAYYLELEYDAERALLTKRLFERAEEHARKSVTESYRFTSARGTRVLLFQGVSATSDAAELLDQEEGGPPLMLQSKYQSRPVQMTADTRTDLVAGFHYRTDAGRLQLQFSMRSHTGFDCQAFARAHGGNGHRAAAGFTVEVSPEVGGNPYAMFKELLEEWERR